MTDALKTYKAKRNFSITPEPAEGGEQGEALSFVIQKHWASRLHYDFRLELNGTMKSWAVPKGPSYDSKDKRMAVHVEDHPISYSSFEGTIPEKQYGAGKVIIWDKGTWHPLDDPEKGYAAGNLKFELRGHKMHGRWVLVRMKGKGEKQEPWLLIKEKDEYTRPAMEFSVVDEMPDSVRQLAAPGTRARGKSGAATKSPGEAVAGDKSASTAQAKRSAGAKAGATVQDDTSQTLVKAPAARGKKAKAASEDADAPQKVVLPETFAPELATLVDAPPSIADDWLFEFKFDGYRLLARIDGKSIQLFTRNGNDWTDRLIPLRDALAKMKLPSGWYDGEIVVNDEQGRPNFGALQLAFDSEKTKSIVYYLFDIPYYDGYDLREAPLESRRALLQAALEKAPESSMVRFSAQIEAPPEEIIAAACKLGLEGVIGKRRDARYVSRRSPDWIKLKCGQRQEFVIGGYTDPQGSRSGIGSLLLGVHDEKGALRYAGNVGSGFSQSVLTDLKKRLDKLASDDCPFASSAGISRKSHWAKPQLLAEVSFAEWTNGGSIRHGVFHGLREDKKPKAIGREKPQHLESKVKKAAAKPAPAAEQGDDVKGSLPASLKVTNPERVIDVESGRTKIDLVRYYALVSGLMLPHLKARPVSLVRAPAGVGGELFFQKHAEIGKLPGVKQFDQALDPDHPPMLEVATEQGLLSSAQWNVVEFHTQNAVGKQYEKPNRVVFDLDPGKGVEWSMIQEAAVLMRAFLEELGLVAFLKTSGGKGLHVVVPLKPFYDWDTVKAFSQAVVVHLSKTIPERFVQKSGATNRVGKIFIDYLRNGRGATTVCAWSARTRPGLGISVPVRWDELPGLKGGDHWTVRSVHDRLDEGNTPWDDYAKSAKSLTPAMKKLGFKPSE